MICLSGRQSKWNSFWILSCRYTRIKFTPSYLILNCTPARSALNSSRSARLLRDYSSSDEHFCRLSRPYNQVQLVTTAYNSIDLFLILNTELSSLEFTPWLAYLSLAVNSEFRWNDFHGPNCNLNKTAHRIILEVPILEVVAPSITKSFRRKALFVAISRMLDPAARVF